MALALDQVLPVQVVREVSKAFLSYEKLEKQEQNCHKQEVIKTKKYFQGKILIWTLTGGLVLEICHVSA